MSYLGMWNLDKKPFVKPPGLRYLLAAHSLMPSKKFFLLKLGEVYSNLSDGDLATLKFQQNIQGPLDTPKSCQFHHNFFLTILSQLAYTVVKC